MEGKEEKMELDEARLVARHMVPRLEMRLDKIVKELVGKFKGGNLTPEAVVQLRADWLASSRLLTEVETLDRGGM